VSRLDWSKARKYKSSESIETESDRRKEYRRLNPKKPVEAEKTRNVFAGGNTTVLRKKK
jgi:hypothetical protein